MGRPIILGRDSCRARQGRNLTAVTVPVQHVLQHRPPPLPAAPCAKPSPSRPVQQDPKGFGTACPCGTQHTGWLVALVAWATLHAELALGAEPAIESVQCLALILTAVQRYGEGQVPHLVQMASSFLWLDSALKSCL